MDIALQILSNILIPGVLFALIVAGFSLIYSVSHVLHLAHGAVAIAAGYVFYWLFYQMHAPAALAVAGALMAAVILSLVMNGQIYERMRRSGVVSTAGSLIATISLLLIVQNGLLAIFGSDTKFFSDLQGKNYAFGPVALTTNEIRIFIICPILLLVFWFFLSKTKFGKALRAVADSETVAEIVGISARRMRMLAFTIGALCAGVAGILFAIEYSLVPAMTIALTLKMFNRAIFGGIDSILGSIIGSLSIETFVQLTSWYWNIAWEGLVTFVAVFILLVWRPHGLLGKKKRSV